MGGLGLQIAVVLVIAWGLGVLSPACAQLAADAPPAATKIVSTPYRGNSAAEALTLWRQDIPRLGDRELLGYFHQHPEETSFPNTAFLLVLSTGQDLNHGRIIWVSYIYNDKQIRPQETWMADIAQPVTANQVNVALVKSISWDVEFRVYSAAITQNLGSFPIRLDPANSRQWPRGGDPLSVHRTQLLGRDISGIAAIRAITAADGLTIHGTRELASTPPVAFHFNVQDRKWSRLEE